VDHHERKMRRKIGSLTGVMFPPPRTRLLSISLCQSVRLSVHFYVLPSFLNTRLKVSGTIASFPIAVFLAKLVSMKIDIIIRRNLSNYDDIGFNQFTAQVILQADTVAL